ncbi:DUF397 domain-containing protein [Streptomyces sp. NPDC013187]|uniref:DUF397 domain-containing protein n=1 Tax=Streptomyces sp. NPDC013187 TaxID=3364865 RepID=UPI0036CE3CD3
MTPNPRLAHVRWVKSSYSSPEGGNCVEWAPSEIVTGRVPVRDSKIPEGPALIFPSEQWQRFVTHVGGSVA